MLNPIVKQHDVVISGTWRPFNDGREIFKLEGDFHIVLISEPERYEEVFREKERMATLPPGYEEDARRLGLEVVDHWMDSRARLGHKAVIGCSFRNTYAPQSPHILAFLNKKVATNKDLVRLLDSDR